MDRARVWTFITYPESLPENWKEIIQDTIVVEVVVSPLHDKDLIDVSNPEKGLKKAHYHNMISFHPNVKSYKQVIEIVKPLGASHCEQVHSVKSMVRYFYHADQKDKAQYSKDEILCFNGADLDSISVRNDKEIFGCLNDILSVIDSEGIVEYCDFVDFVRQNMFNDWFPLIVGQHSFFLNNYIKSKRYKAGIPNG